MTSITLLHLAVFVIAIILFYVLTLRTARLRARFKLYKVRDKLVLFVAQDKLSESSPVFVHFYGRVNMLLQDTPHVGIDDVLSVVLSQKNLKDFDKALAQTQARLARLQKDPSLADLDVKLVVREYMAAVEYSIIVHSSWMRVFFFISKLFTRKIAQSVTDTLAPASAKHAIESIKVFEEIDNQLAMS